MSLDIRITTKLDGHTIPLHNSNITSNLCTMAENVKVSPETEPMRDCVTLFDVLWETHDVKCSSVSPLLREALHTLNTDETLDQFNAPNMWGTRKQFISFISELVTVCEKFPSATYQ